MGAGPEPTTPGAADAARDRQPPHVPHVPLVTAADASAPDGVHRCGWGDAADMRAYHDLEWGRPVTDERGLFERLCLEAFQAGISWRIVLAKRAALRAAFAGFDPDAVAGLGADDLARMRDDAALIRNRRKLAAVVANARVTLALRDAGTPLEELVWSFRPAPEADPPRRLDEVPGSTAASQALAKELRRRGFTFVGPTTAYATMQAAGLVNDHLAGCWVREQVAAEQRTVTMGALGGAAG
jgi:DNA-3-methyladenine glycosylase I